MKLYKKIFFIEKYERHLTFSQLIDKERLNKFKKKL